MTDATNPDMPRQDFFISYNKADRKWAEWIAWQLEAKVYTTVVQAWDFHAGGNFVVEMHQASITAKHTIAVLSPHYLASKYCTAEWAAAFANDPTGEQGLLIPIRVEGCDVKGLLGQIIYIDLVGLDRESAKERLLDLITRKRRKPESEPAHPVVAQEPRYPGTLPPHWNVPHLRNPNFTGRAELLDALRSSLTSGEHAAVTQAIRGLGGVGKTQLALEYAYRYMDEYEIVWWIRAEKTATLAGEYAALATELNLPQKDTPDQGVIVQAVRRWLEQHPKWLLVFDNVTRPDDLHDYLPRGATGHVVITSRYQNWHGVASLLSVKVMNKDEAIAFIIKRTGEIDRKKAEELAEAVDFLPLALEQAGAFIDETGQSIDHYLELFATRRQDLMRHPTPGKDYDETVVTTWRISFDAAREESAVAAELLNLCAFFAPDDIPLDVIRDGVEHLPDPLAPAVRDQLSFDKAVAALRRYSLIEIVGDNVSVHRLVQAVVRDQLLEEAKKTWANAALEVVNATFPFESDDVRTWPECDRLITHALVVAEHADTLSLLSEAAGRLLNQIGTYMWGRASFGEAKAAFEGALKIAEASFGPDHPHVAIRVNNLGMVLKDLGDFSGARHNYERALEIFEASFGPDHPHVARVVNNLGLVLQGLGDLSGAREHFERALKIDEASFGPDHPNVARVINNLGLVLQALGDLSGAREHFERALKIDEASFDPHHPNVAICVNNLGGVLQALGDLSGAREYFERALAIFRKFFAEDHPNVVKVRENLELLQKQLKD